MKLTLSQNGLELIKSFEGLRLTAYKCDASEQFYTIGYGHYGSDVKRGMKITPEQAEELLKQDCQTAVNHVNTYMDKYNFNQNQFDALVSFVYNIGNIKQLTQNKTRTIAQISKAIPLYCKCNGTTLSGLVRRRKAEQELFNKLNATIVSKKTNEEIAKEVIAGKWGNGNERKTRLKDAGYNYTEVQKIVNKMLKG